MQTAVHGWIECCTAMRLCKCLFERKWGNPKLFPSCIYSDWSPFDRLKRFIYGNDFGHRQTDGHTLPSTRQRKPDYAAEHERKSCITLCDHDKYMSGRQRVYLNVKVVLTRQRLRLPLNTHCIYTLVVHHVQRGSVTFSFRYSTFQKHKLHKSLATHLYL